MVVLISSMLILFLLNASAEMKTAVQTHVVIPQKVKSLSPLPLVLCAL